MPDTFRRISVLLVNVLFAVVCLAFTEAGAELPPEIMIDRFLAQAERLRARGDHEAALEKMTRIVDLQKEHALTLPDAFHFSFAQMAFSAGRLTQAMVSVNKYLAGSGREGQFYREALDLSIRIEEIQAVLDQFPATVDSLIGEKDYRAALSAMDTVVVLQREHNLTLPDTFDVMYTRVARFTRTCKGNPYGQCWKVLADRPECLVWNASVVDTAETVTWSGACSLGVAQGPGTLSWTWVWNLWERGDRRFTYEESGKLDDGKKSGNWIETYPNSVVAEGLYVRGKRHGDWVFRAKDRRVSEGAYADNLQEGYWIESDPVSESHLNGKRNGDAGTVWVNTFTDKGYYSRGKRVGSWTTVRHSNGEITVRDY